MGVAGETGVAVGRTIRIRRVPAFEPPYDDERHPDSWLDVPQPQLDLPPPARRVPVDASPATARPATAPGDRGPDASATPRRGGGGSPQLRIAVTRLLHNWLEVLNGYRPLTHVRALSHPLDADGIMAVMTGAVRRFEQLRRRAPTPDERRLRLGRVRLYEPREGAAEIAAVLRNSRQAWALAIRLEHHQGRWLCTSADLPWPGGPATDDPATGGVRRSTPGGSRR